MNIYHYNLKIAKGENNTVVEVFLPHKFWPRPYQLPILAALDNGIKRAVWVCHRRAGKDLTIWNWLIRTAFRERMIAYYILPTYAQAKKVIWTGMTKDGTSFLDYIPEEITLKRNESELTIVLMNGSIIQLVGSENVDSIVGTNPKICVFSEMALQSPLAWQFMRPILAENDGTAIFISTPRGKSEFYDLYNIAKSNPKEWFCERLTVEDTGVISPAQIERERREGMSEELIQQEYFCSFESGIEGSYYGKYMEAAEKEGRICHVPYDKNCLVNTAWDLGYSDSMSLIFYQIRGNEILVIDHYENRGYALNHYLDYLRSKPYHYGSHFAPFDADSKNNVGTTFRSVAAEKGFNFRVLRRDKKIMDGIERLRGVFPRIFFDREKCSYLIKCLTNYHADYDENNRVLSMTPKHDWTSHSSDAARYMAQALEHGSDESGRLRLDEYRKWKQQFGWS